ncbi:hypothetical protein AYO44_14565 [Planctomycetaceae bacterium SCGC AG-212-F19]|nr:hypothetical protein AYO44_14565 [Planctomycetaceae bacterium SCGC AG-212-F19]
MRRLLALWAIAVAVQLPLARAELPAPIKTFKHEGSVDVVAFAPDGKTLAVGSRDSTITLWKLGTDREPRRLTVPVGRLVNLSFSPDSRYLASTGSDGHIRLWSVATGDEVRDFDQKPQVVHYGSFTPDGKTLVAGNSRGIVRRWDPLTGAEMESFQIPAAVRSVACSPDGKAVAVGVSHLRSNKPDGPIAKGLPLLDLANGTPLRSFEGHAAQVLFTPDGRTILGWPDDDMIRLWETVTGRERGRIAGRFNAVAIAPDGKLLAGADRVEGIIRVWDLALLKEVQHFDGHDSDISALAFAPDGKTLASGSGDFTAMLWDLTAVRKKSQTPADPLTVADLETRWNFLAVDDGARAYQAITSLARGPRETPAFIRDRLQRSLIDPKRLARLIVELDDNRFEVREKASEELAKLGNLADPALREALKRNPPLEVVRRIEALQEKLEKGVLAPEQLRQLRAVEALEHMGTPEARAVLDALAAQTPATLMSQEAQAAVRRLAGK